MKRVMSIICCFTACLLLLPGCISVIDTTTHSDSKSSKTDNINLLVKVDLEKNGAPLDSISSIVSKDAIAINHTCQESQTKGNGMMIVLKFSANNIRKISEDSYSMDYNVGLSVPFVVSKSASGSTTQYTQFGSNSSLNIKLDQPVYIYSSNICKAKITITVQK